jgi:hypothetical protein
VARLISVPVLGGGALLASPALWAAFVDATMDVQTALVRYGVGVLVAWLGLSLLGSLVEGTSPKPEPQPDVPRALPAVDGPLPVRAAVVDPPGGAAVRQ